MEPTELYNKAHRLLMAFVGLLLLVMAGGLTSSDGLHLLPFKLERPEWIPHIFSIITAYALYRLAFAWYLQAESVRRRIRVDFRIAVVAAVSALVVYFSIYLLPTVNQLVGANASTVFYVVSVTISVVAAVLSFVGQRVVSKTLTALRAKTLPDLLSRDGWILQFDPSNPNAEKSISFMADGLIGEGRNQNEDRWQIKDGELVIHRSNGDLQNRFVYDATMDRFVSLTDSSAKGIKGQYIYRK